MTVEPEDIEIHRKAWAKIAKEHDWYTEPFYVQVWVDPDTNEIYDSVSTRRLDQDYIVYEYSGDHYDESF